MKDGLLKLLAAATCIFPIVSAEAVQISGTIGFEGSATLSGSSITDATGITSISANVDPLSLTGDYSTVPGGVVVTWTPFDFNQDSVPSLWSFDVGGILYSFTLTEMVVIKNGLILNIAGEGVAHIDNFDDTPGTFGLEITGAQTTFHFGAGFDVPGAHSVPDGGATGILVGLAVCGLVAFRKITG